MRKAVYAFLIFLFFFLFSSKTTFADSNFSTDYNVNYAVSGNANTHVNIVATLTNLTDNYYASSYKIEVGFTDIKNLSAQDSGGPISAILSKTARGSLITLNFNQRIVGLNNKLTFNVSFDTDEIAQDLNNTWNINIPGVSNQEDFSSFNSTVVYPESLGDPTFIKPTLLNQDVSTGASRLFFTKKDLGGSGISIAFGNFQIYDFNLIYHLENKNYFPVSTEIALPPSTNYQEIKIENISPKPTNVKLDQDGNWLAKYVISGNKKIDVKVSGKAKINLNPKQEILNNKSLQTYLKSQTYWNTNDAKIVTLAKDLKTPYAIYQYVVKTLKYDFNRVQTNSPRLGAVKALENPSSAVCLEFTDLFITLSRAAGIPAREIDGYAYSSNSHERPLSLTDDVLHAWPEYYDYDKKTWVMVDPTWGNTTGGIDYFNALDFDHIAFVIRGQNSSYPVPAGGYKLSNNTKTKDVSVKIGGSFAEIPNVPSIDPQIPGNILSGLPINGFIKLSNIGSTLIQKPEVNVSTNRLIPNESRLSGQDIPPYGYILLPISFNRTNLLTNMTDTIKITVGNNTTYKNIRLIPFFVNKLFVIGGILFVSFGIIISIAAYLLRRLSIPEQEK